MQIPSFEKFINSKDYEEVAEKFDQINVPHIIQFDLADKQATQNAISMIYQQSVLKAAQISMINLQAYHEWLRKQLEQ